MNQYLIGKYLQLLRKRNGYTQENLAQEIGVSRQAISKWETGSAIPDVDVLLKLSKLYQVTINEILEPTIEKNRIDDFEQIINVDRSELTAVFDSFAKEEIIKASKGASPQVNELLKKILPNIDFQKEQQALGSVRIEEIEAIHSQVVSLINLVF